MGDFLALFRNKPIFISNPTWAFHEPMFIEAGLKVHKYRYFDAQTKGLDFKGMMEDLEAAEDGATVVFHACAHNPTGNDPSSE